MILWPATLPLLWWCLSSWKDLVFCINPPCTFVLVFSTKLFSCALRRQNLGFQQYLNFSMRPGCALFRNGPVREVARYPLFFCYAPLPVTKMHRSNIILCNSSHSIDHTFNFFRTWLRLDPPSPKPVKKKLTPCFVLNKNKIRDLSES